MTIMKYLKTNSQIQHLLIKYTLRAVIIKYAFHGCETVNTQIVLCLTEENKPYTLTDNVALQKSKRAVQGTFSMSVLYLQGSLCY